MSVADDSDPVEPVRSEAPSPVVPASSSFAQPAGDLTGPLKDLPVQDFLRFRDYIHEHSGIYLEDSKFDSLRISLVARATRFAAEDFDEYFRRLVSDDDEFRELMNLITINETSFLRFPQQFAALRDEVVPELMSRTTMRPSLRVWSAGCSTGEEAYSIAMTLLDSGAGAAGWRFEVLGSDVSTRALEIARTGVYPARALSGLPADLAERHFEPVGEDRYRVRDRVRDLVTFRYHNLIKEPYPASLVGEWDVIFCRNVTIYFKVESTRRVVNGFHASLVPGGYLFVGHSETLTAISTGFETVERNGVYLYRRPIEGHGRAILPAHAARDRVVRPAGAAFPAGARDFAAEGVAAGAVEAVILAGPTASATPRAPRLPRSSGATRRETAEAVGSFARQGAEAIATGATGDAHSAARRIAALDPGSPEAPLLDARAYAEEGDFSAAAEACEKALGINPLLPGARYLLGLVESRRGENEAAERELRKTVYIDPGFALAYLNLGTLYRAQERWDAACEAYGSAVRAAREEPAGPWTAFLGGFEADVLVRTAERGLLECRKASGTA